jgi:hypothetical protein
MRHFLSTFRNAYSNSGNRKSFDKSSSPSPGGGYAAAAAGSVASSSSSSSERERDHDMKPAGVGGEDQLAPELVKGIYKNKQFMTQLTTLIGQSMRVSHVCDWYEPYLPLWGGGGTPPATLPPPSLFLKNVADGQTYYLSKKKTRTGPVFFTT